MTEHLEAHPSIDANDLGTIASNEIASCLWRGPRGLMRGNGTFVWQSVGTLELRYELTRGLPSQNEIFEDTIDLILLENQQIQRRDNWCLECPGCDERRRYLYFADKEWKCRVCHQLQYASQRMGTPVRQVLRSQKLAAIIAGGRPKGMHHKTYRALQGATERLQRLAVKHDFREPNTEVKLRCVFEWQERRRAIKKSKSPPMPPII